MKIKLEITCDCGNTGLYEVENKYHKESHEEYADLTEVIYDNKFRAKPTTSGTWLNCVRCKKGIEVV